MKITLKIWRQKNAMVKGAFKTYQMNDVSPDMSFLEMLDVLNEELLLKGEEQIAFDHDCREGICGTCSCVINGRPHGEEKGTTTCQLHMRKFDDCDTIWVEPFRSKAFPVIKDLIVDRSAFDRMIQAGGFISVNTGAPQDANAIPVSKFDADLAMDAAACIGCGACVASCPNGSAMLFVSAKVSQLARLPQGKIEREQRVWNMARQLDKEGFGSCGNMYECEANCPKSISVKFIAKTNREFLRMTVTGREAISADS